MTTDSSKNVTLCILCRGESILLGMKKRGFGEGKYNGFGGKKKDGETLEQAAVRELEEEIGVRTRQEYLQKRGELSFTFPHKQSWNQTVHVYFVTQWEGEPVESEEMKPECFTAATVPYNKMWEADTYWLPEVLKGKYVRARFVYGEQQQLLEKEIVTI